MPSFTANPSTDHFHGEIRCNGINHKDIGTWGTCDNCGELVIKTHKGHLANVVIGGHDERRGERFQCWQLHRCDEKRAALRGLREAEQLVRGSFPKGVEVEVFKGRKVPVGTVGIVRWVGEGFNSGSERLGLAVEGQEKLVYVDGGNCRVSDEVLAEAHAIVEADATRRQDLADRLQALETELAAIEKDRDSGALWDKIDAARQAPDPKAAFAALWAEGGALAVSVARRDEVLAEIKALQIERGY